MSHSKGNRDLTGDRLTPAEVTRLFKNRLFACPALGCHREEGC